MTGPPIYPQVDIHNAPETSNVGYTVGAVILAAAMVLGGVLIVIGMKSVFTLVAFPQEVSSDGTIQIEESGNYIVYEVGPDSSANSTTVNSGGLRLIGPSGPVTTQPYGTDRSVSAGNRRADAVATFRAVDPGSYTLESDQLPVGRTLAVGDGTKVRVFTLVVGLLVGGLGTLLGGVILIVTAMKNRGKRNQWVQLNLATQQSSWGHIPPAGSVPPGRGSPPPGPHAPGWGPPSGAMPPPYPPQGVVHPPYPPPPPPRPPEPPRAPQSDEKPPWQQ